jgi:excisionase family DNA binding protein
MTEVELLEAVVARLDAIQGQLAHLVQLQQVALREEPQENRDERLAVTVDEAARLLGVSRQYYYEHARRGELPALKIGSKYRGEKILVPRRQLEALLDRVVEQRPS